MITPLNIEFISVPAFLPRINTESPLRCHNPYVCARPARVPDSLSYNTAVATKCDDFPADQLIKCFL